MTGDEAVTRFGGDNLLRMGTQPSLDEGPPRESFKPGSEVGPFRIKRRLGQGGMGEVYEAEQIDMAVADVVAEIDRRGAQRLSPLWEAVVTVPTFVAVLTAFVAIIAIALAAILRGPGALRLLGATIATRDGAPVSRRRATLRSVVAWSPVLAAVAVIVIRNTTGATGGVVNGIVGLTALLILLAGAVCAILEPRLSLPDRIARTVVIPL